jgi:hypothetical protein
MLYAVLLAVVYNPGAFILTSWHCTLFTSPAVLTVATATAANGVFLCVLFPVLGAK